MLRQSLENGERTSFPPIIMKLSIIYWSLFAIHFFLSACSNQGGVPNVSSSPVEEPAPISAITSPPSTTLQKLTYKIGPFSLKAGQKAQTMWESPGSINFQTDEPLWIVSFETAVEDADGGELPNKFLHLAMLTNRSEANPLCTEKETANPFFAATAATGNIKLPENSGYAVLKDDELDAEVVLKNPTAQEFDDVYFKFTLTAVPMMAAKNFQDVMPLFLEIDPCNHAPIIVAPKEFVKKSSTFTVPEDGLLTAAYGLLQDYGVEVSLSAKDQPTPVFEAKAELSSDHKIISLPSFEDPAGIPLFAGDEISLNVAYDNRSEQWHDGATGAIMAYVTRPERDAKPATKKETAITANNVQKMLLK